MFKKIKLKKILIMGFLGQERLSLQRKLKDLKAVWLNGIILKKYKDWDFTKEEELDRLN